MVPFGKRPKTLPEVLSGEEVSRLIDMCDEYQTSHVSADSVCGRTAAERSGASDDCRHRQSADAAASRAAARERRTRRRAAVAATADRTARVLESNIVRRSICFPASTPRCAAGTDDDSEGVQGRGAKKRAFNATSRRTRCVTFFATALTGSGSRSADDQSSAGSREFLHDDDVSARAELCIWDQRAESDRLAAGAAAAGLDAATEQQQPTRCRVSISAAVRGGLCAAASAAAVPQVQSTLAKLSLCRTPAMGSHRIAAISATSNARSTTRAVIVTVRSVPERSAPTGWIRRRSCCCPDLDYYQVVFTMPDQLSSLALGNRRVIFDLLFRVGMEDR